MNHHPAAVKAARRVLDEWGTAASEIGGRVHQQLVAPGNRYEMTDDDRKGGARGIAADANRSGAQTRDRHGVSHCVAAMASSSGAGYGCSGANR